MKNQLCKNLIAGAVVLLASAAVVADNVDAIVERVNAVDEGEFVTRKLTMTLTDKRGKARVRETVSYRKTFPDEKRTVLFYQSPGNIRGTGFLIYDYADSGKEDDQWLYLPAMRKVRRIPSSDRGDYFLGTDFSYEDIKLDGKLDTEDYSYKLLGSSELDGKPVYRVEAVPISEDIARELGYSRTVSYIDKSSYLLLKADFWNSKGEHLKTLTAGDVRQVDGIWTRHELTMENHKTGHVTVFRFEDVDYSTPVRDSLFSRKALERGR